LSQCTRLTDGRTDRRTDGQKGLRNIVRCITCSRMVKITNDLMLLAWRYKL